MPSFQEKILDQKGLSSWVQLHQGHKVVFTNGCFDIIHSGHVTYLEKAKSLGDVLIVGVNSDASVSRLKGHHRPINQLKDRSIVLAAMASVDAVISFDEDTPLRLIEMINPNVLVKGGDWSPDQIVGADLVLSYGGIVKSLPFVVGQSSTSIIQRIINQQ